MNRLEQLLESFRSGDITGAELAELKQLLATEEGRAEARRHLAMESALHQAFQAGPVIETLAARSAGNWWEKLRFHFGFQTSNLKPQTSNLGFAALRRWLLPLAACFALTALGAWTWLALRPVAGLEGVHGAVTVLRGGKIIPGADALVLRAGDVVRTAAGAGARVQWRREATRVELQPDAEVRLTTVKGDKHLALLSGTLTAEVAKQAARHPMILETRQGRVEVLGTRFELSAATNKTRVEVASGRVLLAAAHQDNGYVVEACQSGEVDADGEVEVENLPVTESIQMGLLAHWPLTEGQGAVARDASGNGLDGTIQNPTWTTNEDRVALAFSRSPGLPSEKLSFLRTPELRLPPAFTITFWVRTESRTPRRQVLFTNSRLGNDANGFWLVINRVLPNTPKPATSDDQSLNFRAASGGPDTFARSQSEALVPGRWNFIAVKVNQPIGRAEIFVNGRDVCVQPRILKEFNLSAPLWFGTPPGPYSLPLDGMVRDIRIYERLLEEIETSHLARP